MTLFTDSQFSPEQISLPDYFHNENVEWLRPSEICKNPKFFSDDHSDEPFKRRHEVMKGHNGGFFLAAVAGLTRYPNPFDKVICPWQSLSAFKEGRFRFRFYEEGKLIPVFVVIDDRLPTINEKLIFAQAPGDVFWCALLEKAYAKFIGGYSKLNLGEIPPCFFHLTGQKSLTFKTDSLLPSALYSRLSESRTQKQIICCKHKHDNGNNLEYGAAFTVTGLDMSGTDYMITIRDVTLDEETTMKIIEFKEEYDLVFVTVENKKEARKAKRTLGASLFGGGWDVNGRNMAEMHADQEIYFDGEGSSSPNLLESLEEAAGKTNEFFKELGDSIQNVTQKDVEEVIDGMKDDVEKAVNTVSDFFKKFF